MLSLDGFKVNLENVQHYTNLAHAHNADSFLKVAEQSKQVLIKNFVNQEKEIEELQKQLDLYKGIAESCECNN